MTIHIICLSAMKGLYTVVFLLLLGTINCEDYYDTKLAQRMVQFSAISYEPESSILNWNCSLCKTVPFLEPKIVQNTTNSVFGVIGVSP